MYFVIKNIGDKTVQPHRLLIADKMHLVAFLRQCLSQFRSQNTASAKGWITDDTNPHDLIHNRSR